MKSGQGKSRRRPVHLKIASTLEREIRRSKPGCRLPSEAALARRFAVSTLTLREALARLERDGLVERRHGSGTYVADPAAGRYVAVALGVSVAEAAGSGFFLLASKRVEHLLRGRGYNTRLFLVDQRVMDGKPSSGAAELADEIRRGHVLGVASVASPGSAEWIDAGRDIGLPMAGDGSSFGNRVFVDYSEMLRHALRRLVSEGRRMIGVLAWGITDSEIERVFSEEGARHRPALVRRCEHPTLPGAGYRAFCGLWSTADRKPDGLIVCDELLFNTAAMAVMELDIRVPEDLAIVTHANRGLAHFSPFPVTRMEYDAGDFAACLVELLVALMEGRCRGPAMKTVPFRWIADGAGSDQARPEGNDVASALDRKGAGLP